MNIKKIFASIAVVAAFILYVVYEKGGFNENEGRVTPPAIVQNPPVTATPPPTTQPVADTPPPTPTPNPAPVPSTPQGQYRNGQYTGVVADAYYGNIQVRATIQNGAISDVTFLQHPSDRRESIYINSQAMPYLRAEAIQAQSANVDIVSGATDSSLAFRQSLASALAQAK